MKREEQQLLTFNIGKAAYGIDIEKIKEIIRYSKVTKIPNEDERVLGVIMPRDKLITVIDLKRCLFGESSEPDERDYFIFCDIDNKLFAYQVSDLNEIVHLERSEIMSPSDVVDMRESMITGLLSRNEKIISILDIERAC